MGEEADRRPVGRAGQGGEDVAVPGELHLLEPELAQLPLEQPRELELLQRRRVGVGLASRLRIDADVAQEARERVGLELVGEGRHVHFESMTPLRAGTCIEWPG